MSDSAYSDLADVTYACTIRKKFGWKLPDEAKTIEFRQSRQKPLDEFVNAGDTVGLSIADVDAVALGVGGVDVTTDAGASAAITALDTAISTVSTTRGKLGALQNRFESMINNLQVTTENLAASESRIRDTDMAQQMVSFTKNNVLLQAGTAMLAQANQVPQSILSLLR